MKQNQQMEKEKWHKEKRILDNDIESTNADDVFR